MQSQLGQAQELSKLYGQFLLTPAFWLLTIRSMGGLWQNPGIMQYIVYVQMKDMTRQL